MSELRKRELTGAKIPRNAPCPCGSGKKYKKCHGRDAGLPLVVPPEVLEYFQRIRQEEQALRDRGIYVRVTRPLMIDGKKWWALGGKVYFNRPPNETFHEFIIDILRLTLGREWWEAQQTLDFDRRHFIMNCFEKYLAWRKAIARPENRVSKWLQAPPDGWTRSLVSLAWDACSLLNVSYIPDRLLNRLKTRDGYQGARYELSIAAIFARLRFRIEFLDEKSATSQKRCEFYANHESGLSIAVEAKSQHRPGVIHMPGVADPAEILKGRRLGRLLSRALKQNPDDRPFMIFIDVNAPQTPTVPFAERPWMQDVQKFMQDHFPSATPKRPSPVSGLLFTNYSYHYQLEKRADPGAYLMIVHKYVKRPIPDWVFSGLQAALNHYGDVPLVEAEGEPSVAR